MNNIAFLLHSEEKKVFTSFPSIKVKHPLIVFTNLSNSGSSCIELNSRSSLPNCWQGFFRWRCLYLSEAVKANSIKHRKNCECCHHHSLFKGHNVIVHIVVLNCQKCNQCLKCGKNTLYGIGITEVSECKLIYQKY